MIMGFSESESSSNCRRHPNVKQVPGVCSSCLREKLSKLSHTPSLSRNIRSNLAYSHSSSLSSTPPFSSGSSASAATGARKSPRAPRHRRNGSEAYVSVGMVLNNGLKKSRSVHCAPLSRSRGNNKNFSVDKIFEGCKNNNGGNVIVDKKKSFGIGEEERDRDGNYVNGKKKGGFLKRLINSTSKKTKGALMLSKTMKERSNTTTTAATTKNN